MAAVTILVTQSDELVHDRPVVEAAALEAAVDADIEAFNEYFQRKLNNDEPLSKSERAVIKTYLWWKTHPEKHDAQQASSSEHV